MEWNVDGSVGDFTLSRFIFEITFSIFFFLWRIFLWKLLLSFYLNLKCFNFYPYLSDSLMRLHDNNLQVISYIFRATWSPGALELKGTESPFDLVIRALNKVMKTSTVLICSFWFLRKGAGTIKVVQI